MRKICLIRQPAGLGDIFFCQKIAAKYLNDGYYVIWPIKTEFYYLQAYLSPLITFIPESLSFPNKHLYFDMSIKEPICSEDKSFIFLPLHGCNLTNSSVMISKYESVKMDHTTWKDYFNYTRNRKKEFELFEHLGLGNEEYNLVNPLYASPPNILKKEIKINNGLRNVYMDVIDGFTIFDWSRIIEKAKNIYTVETSFNYIIEKLHTTAEEYGEMVMYSKWTPPDFHHIDGLFKKPWKYIK